MSGHGAVSVHRFHPTVFAFVPSALIMVINPRSFGKLNLTWESVRAVNVDGLRCSAIFQLCRMVPPFLSPFWDHAQGGEELSLPLPLGMPVPAVLVLC